MANRTRPGTKSLQEDEKMTNRTIKECSNPRCRNTWEVRDEAGAQRETCGLCHFEAAAGTQPPSSGEAREAYRDHLQDVTRKLEPLHQVRVFNLGREASLTAALIDPRLHPDSGERKDPPDNIPGELLGAARDLADYLGGDRVPPETNRHGIPHAAGWDLGHTMHLVRDLAFQLDEARREIPESTRLRVLQQVLNLAIETALVSGHRETHPLLDQLVAGSPVDPRDANAR